MRLENPPGLSPITTVGHYDTVEAAQVATDEVWGVLVTDDGTDQAVLARLDRRATSS